MNFRTRAASLHFLASSGVALLSGLLVFLLWYPPPYATLAGGLTLFAMMIGIDVVLGPLLTALVANPSKPRKELQRDIGLIVLVQLLAFGYGMYTIALARPVHMVFEVDRLRVVSAADIDPDRLVKAPEVYRALPWTGPTLIATRKARTNEELMQSVDLGLQGVDLALQPDRWVDYAANASAVLQAARPAKLLTDNYPQALASVQAAAAQHGVALDTLRFLPLTSRQYTWAALVAQPDARIIGYVPVDGFL